LFYLAARELRVIAVEPFIPLAKQLLDLKIALDVILPWVETIHEKAQVENIATDVAAVSVASELRTYRQLGGVQKGLQQIQNQILILDTLYIHKQQAITMLMELQSRGISEAEIIHLVNFAGELNKQFSGGPGMGNGQRNNGSSNSLGKKLDDKLIGAGN
jgi:hypothetical protein